MNAVLERRNVTGTVTDGTILQRIVRDGPNDGSNLITLGDMFNLLVRKGLKPKAIRRLHPYIRPGTIALARAFLLARDPRSCGFERSPSPYRLLVDECISARIIPAVRRGFGYATHTNFVRLQGRGRSHETGDRDLWEWAVNNNIDAILTRDSARGNGERDLTAIAIDAAMDVIGRMETSGVESVDLDELPLVIHVKSKKHDYKAVSALFNRHRDTIASYIETRTTPYIEVRENGVTAGPTYTELWDRQTRAAGKNYAIIPRRDRWKDKWMSLVMKNAANDPAQRQKAADMVKASAAVCAMPHAPEARFLGRNRLGVPRPGAYLP